MEVEERTLLVKRQQPRCVLRSPVGELLTPRRVAPRRAAAATSHPSRAVCIVTLYHAIHARETKRASRRGGLGREIIAIYKYLISSFIIFIDTIEHRCFMLRE